MSAYRFCEECGAALDPGERCDCLSAAPPKLIQPERDQANVSPRHKRLFNADFTGVPLDLELTYTFNGEAGA